nr:hypothetical protein [Tanacetum cinerariifolium]
MTNDAIVTTLVNVTSASVTNTVANHAKKSNKFNGQNFKKWQHKMLFYLTTLNFVRFLKETAPHVEPPKEDSLYNVNCKTNTAKEFRESLERKYKIADAIDAIIEKLPSSWVEFKNYLKHKRKEMSVEDMVIRLRIEEDTCKQTRNETYVSASVKEIDYVQLRIFNQAELKLQPRAFFSFYTAAYTEVKILPNLLRTRRADTEGTSASRTELLQLDSKMVFHPFSFLSGQACTTSLYSAISSFSPSAGEAAALSAEGTHVVVAPDLVSTRVVNLFKDERLEIVEVKVSNFDGISFRSPGELFQFSGQAASKVRDGGGAEVSLVSLSFSTFSCSSLIYETMVGSSVGKSEVKKSDLVSFKISAKSYSFTFRKMSSAPDSSFALEVVWAVFDPSSADLILSTRTLGLDPARADILRSTSVVKSTEASCPDADSGCKMKEVDQAEYLGALESTGTSRLQMVFMWSVKGGSSGVFLGYSQNSKAYIVLNKHTLKVKESLNVTFDESPPLTKLSPLVDDDVGEEEAIENNTKVVNNNNEEDESIEVDKVVNIKESKNHPLE